MDDSHRVISIRGFSDLYGNKVLVLIDGRSTYRTTFSGVRWDEMDMVLEDIDRIEVIRGPGGAVWGANAMNGVINIITKSAKDTQGGRMNFTGRLLYQDRLRSQRVQQYTRSGFSSSPRNRIATRCRVGTDSSTSRVRSSPPQPKRLSASTGRRRGPTRDE
jgi:outer membrane receptor for ferrienterochelin and colicin